jgi:hypothetical protein
MDVEEEFFLEELAYMAMETEKSYNLPPTH